jgi:hypothetical protein
MTTSIKVPNREIAILAFDHLRHERKTIPALRLAYHLLHHEGISLGIGDTDWDIDTALQRYGGEPRTGYGHSAHFDFNGKTVMERDRFQRTFYEEDR